MFCGSAAQIPSETALDTFTKKKKNYSNSPVGHKCACSSTDHHRTMLTYLITLSASVLTNGSAEVFAKIMLSPLFIGIRAMDTCRASFGNIQHLIEINEALQLKYPPVFFASAPCYRSRARCPKSDPSFQRKCKVKHDHLRPSYPFPSHNLHHPNVQK